jgi:hypothetical protein
LASRAAQSLAVSLANDLVGDVRSELPAGGPATHPDARLLELEENIFKHKAAFDALQPETDRLNNIWCNENHRLAAEFENTRIWPTFDERKAIVEPCRNLMNLCGYVNCKKISAKRPTI